MSEHYYIRRHGHWYEASMGEHYRQNTLYDRRREREEGIDNGDSAEDGKIIVFNNEK